MTVRRIQFMFSCTKTLWAGNLLGFFMLLFQKEERICGLVDNHSQWIGWYMRIVILCLAQSHWFKQHLYNFWSQMKMWSKREILQIEYEGRLCFCIFFLYSFPWNVSKTDWNFPSHLQDQRPHFVFVFGIFSERYYANDSKFCSLFLLL